MLHREPMSILISAYQLKMAFAARPLFDGITFSIESGEKIGLIGPNGAGKSTLLKILAGLISPDEGKLSFQRGLRVGYLEQSPTFRPGVTVREAVLEGAKDPEDGQTVALLEELLSRLSLKGDSESGGISADSHVEDLSGGWKKRVALARELLKQPDLLLLDEPTNHLDVESILWLEEMIHEAAFAVLTITHDRVFLQKASTRILELDRRNPGGLLSVNGDYATYLETKESMLAASLSSELRLKNTLRRETEWLRRGAKARTTKQQARIQRAEELGDTVSELAYRNQDRQVRLDFQAADKTSKKLIEAKGISKSYDGHQIIPPMDFLMTPTTRLGLLGANGCGKSTLIRLLVGTEQPDQGSVQKAQNLEIAYFEQNREALDLKTTLVKTLCPYGDHVDYRGTRVHIKSYLDRFLFRPEQMDMVVGKLSGGEQSRLLIAQLMLQKANMLVLDEPTNDLDMATLNVLEEVLREFNGAVILVTHDRYFLDQVAKQILAFSVNPKGDRQMTSFASLDQWERWREAQKQTAVRGSSGNMTSSDRSEKAAAPKKRKLSFKDQREFDTMEQRIQEAEMRLATLTEESLKPELATQATRLTELTAQMAETQDEIDRLYVRWGELGEQ